MSCFDKWLNRATSLSQLILVIIAAVTIKLTVIPLYQKELNSEELAKAQLKLNTVQAETENLAKKVMEKESKLLDTVSLLEQLSETERQVRAKLELVNAELSDKTKDLVVIRSQNKMVLAESRRLKEQVVSDYQLKFRQSLEWYAMTTSIRRDCYGPDLSGIFADPRQRKAETAKGCGPYAFLKEGLRTLRDIRKDPSGDPLDIPEATFESWLSITDYKIEKERSSIGTAFDPGIYKSLDSDNLVQKEHESASEFQKRVSQVKKASDDYSRRARDKDLDLENRFIRDLSLPM